jgi:hypothetical protein
MKVAEHLPSKHKTLSSTPSTPKNKIKRKKKATEKTRGKNEEMI